MRYRLGSWRCRSGNRVDAYLHIEGRAVRQLDLEWDAPPPLSEQDLADYLTIILPSLTKAAQEFIERPGLALVLTP